MRRIAPVRLEVRTGTQNATAANRLGGALTTCGSLLFMFGCEFPFLLSLSHLVTAAVGLNAVQAVFLFLPLCAVFGPERLG